MPIKSFLRKEVLAHPVIIASLGIVATVAIGSYIYSATSSRVPPPLPGPSAASTEEVTGTGSVTPAQNPDLAFASGGRVTLVQATVGQNVAQGQLLASLDTSALAAQKAQAKAALAAAQAAVATQEAKLQGLQAGARPEDIAASQAALDKAMQDLANMYSGIGDISTDGFAKANDAARVQLDQFFSNGETGAPKLTYVTSNSQAKTDAEAQRSVVASALNSWQAELGTADQSNAALDVRIQNDLSYLSAVRQVLGLVSKTFDNAPSLSAATLAAYKAQATAALNEVNTASKNLNTATENIASQKLTVAQAKAQLDLKKAGASNTDIKAQEAQVESARASVESAQASIEGISAQIGNAIIVAPFSGEVTAVAVKSGQIVAPDTTAVSLTPKSALQVDMYVSEIDVAKLHTGMAADVTLDAYGSSRHFPAVVVAVDRSPTARNNIPAYKVTLQFDTNDPAIATGMTANVTILLSH